MNDRSPARRRPKSWLAAVGPTAVTALTALTAHLAPAAHGQTATMVRDLGPADSEARIEVQSFFPLGDRLLFSGGYLSGPYLWVSDGTASGTQPLSSPCRVACDGLSFLGGVGGLAYFVPSGGHSRGELWRTDGTRAGTFRLRAGGLSLVPSTPLAHLGDEAYFGACPAPEQCGLWANDGTGAGTRLVSGAAPFSVPDQELIAFRGRLYFGARPGGDAALWASDGTPAGTAAALRLGSVPRRLTTTANRLFFIGAPGANTARGAVEQLWASDGTAAGTHPVTAFAGSVALAGTQWLKPAGNRVYFAARGTRGAELWVSDGTPAGTVRVADVPFRVAPSATEIAEVGGKLAFVARDGADTTSLWVTSGSPASTAPLCLGAGACHPARSNLVLARDGQHIVFLSGEPDGRVTLWATDGTAAGTGALTTCPAACSDDTDLAPLAGTVFFGVRRGSGQIELWRTDGTGAGTRRFGSQILPRQASLPRQLGALGEQVFFVTNDTQLLASDGTDAGTRRLSALSDTAAFFPTLFAALGSQVFFSSASAGGGLWASDGTAAGTRPVAGVPGGAVLPLYPDLVPLMAAAGQVFFIERDRTGNPQLWRTDATGADTVELTAFPSGVVMGAGPVACRGQVFFEAGGPLLWKSDGTPAGTVKAVDFPPQVFGIAYLAALEPDLYLVAFMEQGGGLRAPDVWRSDGTAGGTVRLTDFGTYLGGVEPQFTRAGGWVYFRAASGPQEGVAYLWRTDGTAAGTTRVGGGEIVAPTGLTAVGGTLFFFAGDPSAGVSLWRSDASATGTSKLADFPCRDLDCPQALTAVGNRLFFAASDDVHGAELWTSDGTAAGTALVRDIEPGPDGSSPTGLTAAGGRLFFTATDSVHGAELWTSDGTADGTRLVQDINPGPAGSHPVAMVEAGGRLFIAANDGLTGIQPWALPLSGGPACQPSATVLCLQGSRFQVEAFWRDFDGAAGHGQAVALSADTGYFWFFGPANVEVIAKVLDGRPLNAHFWVFFGALSNVEYWLTVTDTQTGFARRYGNSPGQFASVGDTTAFGPLGAFALPGPVPAQQPAGGAVPARAPRGPSSRPPVIAASAAITAIAAGTAAEEGTGCPQGPNRLCLNGGRFAVTASWRDFDGQAGNGSAVGLTGETGYFWFFGPSNVEVVVKVLDGRAVNGKFWVFYGALSDVEYTLTVTDTSTGAVKTYSNPSGRFASVGDTEAF